MKNLIKAPFIPVFFAWMLLFPLLGCEKEEQNEAPQLPPESSFVIDFSDFENQTKSLLLDDTYQNFTLAVVHVAVWNTVIILHAAVPIAAYREAFNHKPVEQPDGSWLWSYTVQVGFATYTANLYGRTEGIYIQWEMYINKSGPGAFDDFLWYTGESHMAGTNGTWTLYKSPNEAIPFVRIDWHNNLDGTFDIAYINIVPDGPENGGFISHGVTKDLPYNAFYEIFNKGQNNLVEINWNRFYMTGQIKDPNFFGDDEFHCWDEAGIDITCP